MDSGWYLGEGEPVLFKHVAFSRVNIPSSVFPHSKAYGIQINTKGTFVKLKKWRRVRSQKGGNVRAGMKV